VVQINSSSRLLTIEAKILLTQTDTTVGFLSQNETRLRAIKSRQDLKPFITVYKNFSSLLQKRVRVPNRQKNRVRRSKKTTFIVKNFAFRVAQDTLESSILRTLAWNYSSSANESGKKFDRNFCEEKADIIVEDKYSLHEGPASSLYKINSKKTKRLR
jgi:tRNA A37 threonylcarbamoyladenosine synthetase subunit TsaC/SUA5/YrdC